MGWIKETPAGRYKACYRTPDDRQERSKTFDRKGDATRFLNEVESDKSRGTWVDPKAGRATFAAWFNDFMESATLAASTRNQYEYLGRRFLLPAFGSTELARITPAQVRAWHVKALKEPRRRKAKAGRKPATQPPVSANTVAKAYRLLSRVLRLAADDQVIPRNPCRISGAGVERSPEMQHATPAKVIELADVVDERYRAAVILAGFGGLRWGEVAGLRVGRVDLLHKRVHVVEQVSEVNGTLTFKVPKTDAGRRMVALPQVAVQALERHLSRWAEEGPDGLVFPAPDGGPMRRSNFRRRVWVPATKAVGMPGFRFHDLRHSAGTMAAVAGATTKELMARIGHASPRAALIYQHASDERDAEIAARLDGFAASLRPEADSGPSADVVALPENRRSPGLSGGGDDGNRTHDPLLAKQVL